MDAKVMFVAILLVMAAVIEDSQSAKLTLRKKSCPKSLVQHCSNTCQLDAHCYRGKCCENACGGRSCATSSGKIALSNYESPQSPAAPRRF